MSSAQLLEFSDVAAEVVRTNFYVYIAASRRHLAEVRLLGGILKAADRKIRVMDWTIKSLEASGEAGRDAVFSFCRNASMFGDLVIYFGESGQDAAVQAGMAYAAGVPVIGIRGAGERPGLMLNGAVTVWKSILEVPRAARIMANCRNANCRCCGFLDSCDIGISTT